MVNPKYVPASLTRKDRKTQLSLLNKSRRLYKQGKYYTRKQVPSFKSVPSPHVKKAMRIYNVSSMKPSRDLAKKTGCSIKALNQIIRKGEGAYYSSGSRPNQTPQSWAYARLASAVTGGNASTVDYHILEAECDHKGRAFLMAKPRR